MDAVSAGSVEGLTRGELNEEVERIEREVRRRLPIGWSTSYASLVKEFVTSQGYSQHALERTLFIMEKREVIRFSGQVRRRPRRLCFPYRCLTLPSPRGLLSLPFFCIAPVEEGGASSRSVRRSTIKPSAPLCIDLLPVSSPGSSLSPLHPLLVLVHSVSFPFLSSYDHFALLSDCRRRAAVVQRTTTSIGALRRRDAETETEEQKGRERNGQRDPEQEENEDKAM